MTKRIKTGADRVQDVEYNKMADKLSVALQTYNGALKPQLLANLEHLQASIKAFGLASEKTDSSYENVSQILDMIEVEADLERNAPTEWSEEERRAHIRELMQSLI